MIIKHPFPTSHPARQPKLSKITRQNKNASKPVLLGVKGRLFQASHVQIKTCSQTMTKCFRTSAL